MEQNTGKVWLGQDSNHDHPIYKNSLSYWKLEFLILYEDKKLTKIYIRGRHRHEYQELGIWGQVTSSWFNPKLTSNPPAIENVLELHIFPSEIPQNFEMTQIAEKMKNLEKRLSL